MKPGTVNIKSLGFSAAVIVMFVAFGIAAPNFATPGNVFSMLHAVAPLTIASCGIALVILTGKIDISIGSISFLSASTAALLMEQLNLPWELALPIIIFGAALMGAVNGFLIAILKIDSLIATHWDNDHIPWDRPDADELAGDCLAGGCSVPQQLVDWLFLA
ncbi:ABC transporter permease [Klebsiella michiganensis]|uniref:ABC transporter permease n=1 Tax=Klebsiella michiganensis TaxID=1134687 RepID=UPI0021C82F65|nr:hypothetical protein [Klebsiella michiganensis]UXO81805.1 hypothetical protein N7918_29245 [Klebsiella michiganensis]